MPQYQPAYTQQTVHHQQPMMFQHAPVAPRTVYPGQPAGQIIVEQEQRKGMGEDEAVCCISYKLHGTASWTHAPAL